MDSHAVADWHHLTVKQTKSYFKLFHLFQAIIYHTVYVRNAADTTSERGNFYRKFCSFLNTALPVVSPWFPWRKTKAESSSRAWWTLLEQNRCTSTCLYHHGNGTEEMAEVDSDGVFRSRYFIHSPVYAAVRYVLGSEVHKSRRTSEVYIR